MSKIKNSEFGQETLGHILKTAREDKGYTLEKVSQKLVLSSGLLESFESDNFEIKDKDPVFVKGYLKRYLALLGLPESLLASANIEQGVKPVYSKKRVKKVFLDINKIIVLIVLLLILITISLWWFSQSNSNQENVDVTAETTQTVMPYNSDTDRVVSNEGNNLEQSTALKNNYVLQSSEDTALLSNVDDESQGETQLSASQVLSQNFDENQSTQPTEIQKEQTNKVEDQKAYAEHKLYITFNDDCWIEIKVNNKRQVSKTFKKGDVYSLDQDGKYRIILGASDNAQLFFNGEEINLKEHSRKGGRASITFDK